MFSVLAVSDRPTQMHQVASDLIIQFFHPEGIRPSGDVPSFSGVFKMGMDVFGNTPRSDKGTYFRNNVWWWHPLWQYCETVAADIIPTANLGHWNNGWGLDDDGATALAGRLELALQSGDTHRYAEQYHQRLCALPYQPCPVCGATGHRAEPPAIGPGPLLCNACEGKGEVPDFDTHYPFDEDNVREFAEFLRLCGGFRIC